MRKTKKYIPYLKSFDRYGKQRFYVWDTELNAWTLDYKCAGLYTLSELIKLKRKYGVSGKTISVIDLNFDCLTNKTNEEIVKVNDALYGANVNAWELLYSVENNQTLVNFENYIYLYDKNLKTINEILL